MLRSHIAPALSFARVLQWTWRRVWTSNVWKVVGLVILGVISRFSLMAGFIGALQGMGLVISQPHRLKVLSHLEHFHLAFIGEFGLIVGIMTCIMFFFGLSLACGLLKKQMVESTCDAVAKGAQARLFRKFRAEMSTSLEGKKEKEIANIYVGYALALEQRLMLALRNASAAMIEVLTNFLLLAVTMSILISQDVSIFLFQAVLLFSFAAIFLNLSYREIVLQTRTRLTAHALARTRVKARSERFHSVREQSDWEAFEKEHELEVHTRLTGEGAANRFYSAVRGISVRRVLSSPPTIAPLLAVLLFTFLIVYFFELSELGPVNVHWAIFVVLLARFGLQYGQTLVFETVKITRNLDNLKLLVKLIETDEPVLLHISNKVESEDDEDKSDSTEDEL